MNVNNIDPKNSTNYCIYSSAAPFNYKDDSEKKIYKIPETVQKFQNTHGARYHNVGTIANLYNKQKVFEMHATLNPDMPLKQTEALNSQDYGDLLPIDTYDLKNLYAMIDALYNSDVNSLLESSKDTQRILTVITNRNALKTAYEKHKFAFIKLSNNNNEFVPFTYKTLTGTTNGNFASPIEVRLSKEIVTNFFNELYRLHGKTKGGDTETSFELDDFQKAVDDHRMFHIDARKKLKPIELSATKPTEFQFFEDRIWSKKAQAFMDSGVGSKDELWKEMMTHVESNTLCNAYAHIQHENFSFYLTVKLDTTEDGVIMPFRINNACLAATVTNGKGVIADAGNAVLACYHHVNKKFPSDKHNQSKTFDGVKWEEYHNIPIDALFKDGKAERKFLLTNTVVHVLSDYEMDDLMAIEVFSKLRPKEINVHMAKNDYKHSEEDDTLLESMVDITNKFLNKKIKGVIHKGAFSTHVNVNQVKSQMNNNFEPALLSTPTK